MGRLPEQAHLGSSTRWILPLLLLTIVVGNGCSMVRRADRDEAPETASADSGEGEATSSENEPDRLTQLSDALSRATARIEELDAKIAALTDKLEAQKIALDNVLGTKPMKSQVVGSAKHDSSAGAAAAENGLTISDPEDNVTDAATDHQIATRFRSALDSFKLGKYSDAVLAFNQITEAFPTHVLAGSAQFYAGESYYMMGEYKLAINEFGKVISAFSHSPRVASALVRMSHCYGALGNKGESLRTAALARDLYFGNPSLEWSAPGDTKAINTQSNAVNVATLEAEPMDSKQPDNHKETTEPKNDH